MKAKLLFALTLLATVSMTSCKKDKEEKEPTSVNIGGKDYGIVTIGSQVWMNANYEGSGGDYYQQDNANVTVYGKYYTLDEAKAVSLPAGWRLPTKDDFKKLLEAQGATVEVDGDGGYTDNAEAVSKLMAKTKWVQNAGTNASGFNLFPAGYKDGNTFSIQGVNAYLWTSSTYGSSNYPLYFGLYTIGGQTAAAYEGEGSLNGIRFPVRFVKDK